MVVENNQSEYNKLLENLFKAFMARQDILYENVDPDILKAHAMVESMMDKILVAALFKDPKIIYKQPKIITQILEKVNFSSKLEILKKNNLVGKTISSKIHKLNDVRISHAHVKSDIKEKLLQSFSLADIQHPLAKSFLNQIDPAAFYSAAIKDELNKVIKEENKNNK